MKHRFPRRSCRIGIGFDPGFRSGAVAIVWEPKANRQPVWMHVTALTNTIDTCGIVTWLESHLGEEDLWDRERIVVVLEQVASMPRQGVASTFKFGVAYGQMMDRIRSLDLKRHDVRPQAWKKAQLGSLNKSDKQSSIQRVQGLYPGIELRRPTEGTNTIRANTKPWDGAAEAILLARHALELG